MSKDKVAVNISKELYELVRKRVNESGEEFKDVEEYVEFVLSEVVKDEDEEQKYSKEDEEQIKQRLKSLGYM